ncbi:Uncharacterised protein [Salmonella enterica subsp. enterica serovar Typhimurium]|nr:Uncharacterised protein [Salmonella enterica subsp. enterica serovar Typhimurium]
MGTPNPLVKRKAPEPHSGCIPAAAMRLKIHWLMMTGCDWQVLRICSPEK